MLCEQGLELIEERRSMRAYEDAQISEEELDALVKVAINSPSAHNKQLFHFSVVQDRELLEGISETIRQKMLRGDEATVAKASAPGYTPLYHAPTAIFISGDLESGFNVQTDCGIAAGLLLAAAEEMGLAACMTNSSLFMFDGESGDELKARIGIPEGYKAIGAVIVGYGKGDRPAAKPRKEDLVSFIK